MIFSFADAYGMGANDVANSFATSVASGTLTLKEAVCIAVFTEFIGAFFLGSQTSSTISGGIIDATRFKNQPELLMLGMTTSVFGSATWVIFATSRGWPVSSTHSVIGAIIGMGIAAYGLETVKWGYDGIAKIVTSCNGMPGPQPLIKELTQDEIAEIKEKTDIEEQKESQSFMGRVKKIALRGVNKDVRSLDNPELESIHARAKKYDNDTELLFEFIQVLTSCAASFAHGSNDVSNAVGPLSAVYHIWKTAQVPNDQTKVALWNLAYCAIGIDIGLATYGYHLMRTLGNNITYTTPSRGFAAELGTSLTIVTASRIGIPVSTTHCITGAMVGVGLCNGDMKAINWKMFAVCFLSWVITLPAAGLLSGILFALIAYSPQKNS
ncbi:putative phosphate permease [Smittium culicis]|uniref:Phosphate transporter n=1 Tax=Smittium culicis TaxID=133412 RepID=A0A1R1WXF4_9FUNG|nr:putative phosphate permease [Smittium culicis]OMJ10715.1 putative phosphate permease [Smittium culicis]